MRHAIRAVAIGAAMAGATVPQIAAAGARDADVACLAVMTVLAEQGGGAITQAATMGRFYYLGRVTARDDDVDIESALRKQAGRITPETLMPMGQQCFAQIEASVAAIDKASSALGGEAAGGN